MSRQRRGHGRLLRQAPLQVNKRILGVPARMALAAAAVTVAESELLRAVADGLGCPAPTLTATSFTLPRRTSVKSAG